MAKKPNDEKFEVTELDDQSLEDVAGGLLDKNTNCDGATCNNVSGCACKQIN